MVSYGNPKAIPGSVSISLDANGEPENFYADRIAYYVINNNMGYEGDLELALIPEDFRTEILKEELDDNGVLIENAQVELESFALLFEFDGEQRHIRHVLYNCTASRPGIEGKTNEDTREESSNLDMFSLEMFENITFVMAKHADASIPNTPEEWLDGFNTFSIYRVLPQLIELWGLNVQTDVEAKKTSSDRP